jgi:DNA-directed RNA polymerase specialized sigma24 family protein
MTSHSTTRTTRTARTARTAPTPAEQVAEWISSPEARKAARSELGRVGFPDPALGADDLLQVVAMRVLARLATRPLDDPGGVVAYLRASLRNAALDAYRSGRARRVGPLLGPDDEDEAAHDPPDPRIEVPGDLEGRADDVRSHLLDGALADPPRVLSGALTVVALAADPRLLDVVRSVGPEGGSPRNRLLWAAVAYSGRPDDLPGFGRPDDPARRQRRSRAMAAIDAALHRAGTASVEADR